MKIISIYDFLLIENKIPQSDKLMLIIFAGKNAREAIVKNGAKKMVPKISCILIPPLIMSKSIVSMEYIMIVKKRQIRFDKRSFLPSTF